MPKFSYTARDRSGQSVAATIEASSRKDVVRLLNARGLSPLQIEESALVRATPLVKRTGGKTAASSTAAPAERQPSFRVARGTVKLSRKHQLPFLQSLLDLTTSGLSAGEAIRLLSVRIQEPALRALCTRLWERLSEGSPLSRAMGETPEVFPNSTVNLIQAGEATGNLNDVLQRLISHLTEQDELRKKLLTALAYPVFMMVVAGGVICFFLFFLLPRMQVLLTSLGGKLPASTRFLVGMSDFALSPAGLITVGVAVFAALSIWRYRATEVGRAKTDALLLRLPMVGEFVMSQTVLAFSQTLSVLLENGITAADALRMTERQINNVVHRDAFNVATGRVLEGEALSVALQRTGCFPALVLDRLAVGENTGNVVPSLKKVAVAYQKSISSQLDVFTRVIASGVLLSVFIFVGFIAFSIVSAVFQLSASFKTGGA